MNRFFGQTLVFLTFLAAIFIYTATIEWNLDPRNWWMITTVPGRIVLTFVICMAGSLSYAEEAPTDSDDQKD